MALAVNLLFDAETTAAVEQIWRALDEAQVSRDMLDLGYPPHVTLVVVEDETLEPQLRQSLSLGEGRSALSLLIGPVRRFDATTITWLAVDGDGLHAIQAGVAATVPTASIREHYRPGQWTPHMTLQTKGDPEVGRAIARRLWPSAREALAVRLDMCSFLPVVPMKGIDLAR